MRVMLALMAILATTPAWAHDWYDPACCSGKDCEPLPPEAVQDVPGGWHVHYMSKTGFLVDSFVPTGKERHSQDGRFHGCASQVRFLCLYVPSVS